MDQAPAGEPIRRASPAVSPRGTRAPRLDSALFPHLFTERSRRVILRFLRPPPSLENTLAGCELIYCNCVGIFHQRLSQFPSSFPGFQEPDRSEGVARAYKSDRRFIPRRRSEPNLILGSSFCVQIQSYGTS